MKGNKPLIPEFNARTKDYATTAAALSLIERLYDKGLLANEEYARIVNEAENKNHRQEVK